MKMFFHLLLAVLSLNLLAQDNEANDSSNFKIGVYAGYYISGDATAVYYSARDNNRLNYFLQNPQIENQIRESLNGYEFELAEYAQDMSYNNTASFELQMTYSFPGNWNISARFHSVTLVAASIFTLRVDRPNQGNPQTSDPYLEEAEISGKETRSHIDIGVGRQFEFNNNFFALTEAGVDLNFLKVKENKIRIAEQPYTLPTYTNVLNQQATPSATFGSGFYLMAGMGFQFPGRIDIVLKATWMRTRINVNNVSKASVNIFIPAIGFTRRF